MKLLINTVASLPNQSCLKSTSAVFKNAKRAVARMLLISCMTLVLQTTSFGQPGSLDNSFATAGKLITSLGSFNDGINSIAIQSDKKIVLGGYAQSSFTASNFALIRCNMDGTLDANFGTGGIVITPFESGSQGKSLGIQSDGKILLGGFSKWYINLVRYNSDGSLDTGFGTGGKVITDINGYYSEKCNSLVIQSDGKILVGGYAQHNSNDKPYFIVARYNGDGSLDNTFGTNGIVVGTEGQGNSMAIQSDGKIILGGAFNFSFAMERYNANGTTDFAFGVNGKVITPFGSSSKANALSIQNNGQILLAGYSNSSASSDFAMARYNSNGTLDITFGIGGKVLTPIGISSPQNIGNSLGIQNNGKILFAGSAKNGSNYTDFALARYENDGSLDTSFGTGGKVLTPLGNSYSTGRSLSIQSDGKILLGGVTFVDSTTDVSLVRYNADVFAGVEEPFSEKMESRIYPHPVNSSATMQFNAALNNAELKIYNLCGQEVMRITNISTREILLSRGNLPNGAYFIQLIEDDKIIAKTKLIVCDN